MTTGPDLTFGIELEAIYVARRSEPPDPDIERRDMRLAIALATVRDALQQGCKAKCVQCGEDVCFKLPVSDVHGDDDSDPGNLYASWDVVEETLVATDAEHTAVGDPSLYCFVGLEIKSRILKLREGLKVPGRFPAHEHEISYVDEIRAVVDLLRDRFATFDSETVRFDYLYPNPQQCALHVHVGQGDLGFDVQTIKNLLCMSIACERLIDQVAATNRITGSDYGIRPLLASSVPASAFMPLITTMDAEVMNSPLSVAFLQNAYRRRRIDRGLLRPRTRDNGKYPDSALVATPWLRQVCGRFDMDNWMLLVDNAPNIEALVNLLGPRPRSSTVNIQNLCPLGEGVHSDADPPTVEFRQHTGTIQAKPILCWIDFVTRLTWFCRTTSWDHVRELCEADSMLRKPEATFIDLCNVLHCKPDTTEYYKNLIAGLVARNMRHNESQQAKQATTNPLAALALHNIVEQRLSLTPANVKVRTTTKLRCGGYGQFTRPMLDALMDASISEEDKERVTLGWQSPVATEQDEIEQSHLPGLVARPGSSGSERSVYSNASDLFREQ